MSPEEVGKVWATFLLSDKKGVKVTNKEISEMVVKQDGAHPTPQAISQMKKEYEKRKSSNRRVANPKAKVKPKTRRKKTHNALSEGQRKKIAESAMRIKKKGGEPSAAAVMRAAPKATTNPHTGESLDPKTITKIFATHCFDDGGNKDDKWEHRQRLTRTSLSESQMGERLFWANNLLATPNLNAGYFHRHVVFFDPCFSILPGTQDKMDMCTRSNGRGKMWCSNASRDASRNLQGSAYVKQRSWTDLQVYWYIVLARGKIGVLLVDKKDSWKNIEKFLGRLDEWLQEKITPPLPRCLFSDRGSPMYVPSGWSTKDYRNCAEARGFRLWTGPDGSSQPGHIADLLPHETGVAWIRSLTKPSASFGCKKVGESKTEFKNRMGRAVEYINGNYEVGNLSRCFPRRIQELVDKGGDKLKY